MPGRPWNAGPLVDTVASDATPKLRLAINQFALAYARETFAAICVAVSRNRADSIFFRVYDEHWNQIVADRACPTFERALQLGERFFNTPRHAWALASTEIQPWREPVAGEFERLRMDQLQALRTALAADVD
jgi:hypothetical protein